MGERISGGLIGGQYRLERALGQGATGAVYLATHLKLGHKVAIKFLDAAWLAVPEVVERFNREGRAAVSVKHPGVVEVLDLGTTPEGLPYLVLEYLEGPTLQQFIERTGPLEPRLATAVLEPVLSALEAAHAVGVIHRDLKPANVILSTGPRRAVKLVDFGIARLGSGPRVTRVGAALGTPQYMAPEQAVDAQTATVASDLYAVGVMAFELLSGRLPLDAPDAPGMMAAAVRTLAPPLATRVPDIDPRLAKLVDALLAKDPGARPSSAAELRAALVGIAPPDVEGLWARVVPDDEAGVAPTRVRPAIAPEASLQAAEPASPPAAPRSAGTTRRLVFAVLGVLAVGLGAGLSAWRDQKPAVVPPTPVISPPVTAAKPVPPSLNTSPLPALAVQRAEAAFAAGNFPEALAAKRDCERGGSSCAALATLEKRIAAEEANLKHLEAANRAVEAGRLKDAARELELARSTRAFTNLLRQIEQRARPIPNTPEARLAAACRAHHSHNDVEARKQVKVCLQLDQTNLMCWLALFNIELELKHYTEATDAKKRYFELGGKAGVDVCY